MSGRPVTRLLPGGARYAGGAGAGLSDDAHLIPAKNRFSRVVLPFAGVTPGLWCEFAFGLAWGVTEGGRNALDFALVGVDFLAGDGSSLDFDHVPGLDRTLLDPHAAWVPGPAYQAGDAPELRCALVRLAFLVPEPARDLVLTVRSWRNTEVFTVSGPVLRQAGDGAAPARSARMRLTPEPDRHRYALVPGCSLILRGQVHADRPGERAALAHVTYRDADGATLPPPYPGTLLVPAFGALVDLPTHQQARRFTLEFEPPPGAVHLDVGFATWEEGGPEAELLGAPEVSLEDGLRLESLCGDDLLSAPDFLARLAERLDLPVAIIERWCPAPDEAASIPLVLAAARAIQRGDVDRAVGLDRTLRLGTAPAWTRPETPDWAEDPFRSVPWRLDYQSLTWLVPIAEAPGGASTAVGLALSWSRANPWGGAADGLALHPAALPERTETFLRLLGRTGRPGGANSLTLTGEIVRHGFALAEIVGQNTFGRSLHQIRAAAVLLAVARALPRLPLSAHWLALARTALRAGTAALLGAEGAFFDPSLHQRLELLTLLRALTSALPVGDEDGGEDDLAAFVAGRLDGASAAVTGLLDPGGRLPPFGDSQHGGDPAGWIGRYLARSGRALVAERRSAPSRPGAGAPRFRADPAAGMISARHDAPGRGWGHFACTFAGAGHGHRDCTSFVYASESVRWIVEAGGSGQVETGAARHHLLSARAHNVAVPDRRDPIAGHGWHKGTTRLDGATACALGTTVHGPDYAHARIFVILDDLSGVAVLDRFDAGGRPVTFEGLLHLSPEILVAIAGPRRAVAQSGRSRLSLVPVALSGQAAGLEIVNGRADRPGAMQGFVSQQPGTLQATSVLRYVLSGAGIVCGGVVMAADSVAEQRLSVLLAGPALGAVLAEP